MSMPHGGFAALSNRHSPALCDVIDGPQGHMDRDGRRRDHSLRPNQLFAVSLDGELLSADRQRRVVEMCAAMLLTPVGLRSLAPHEPGYCGRYEGDGGLRDARYHQGTVWSWLLGPYALAHYRVYGDAAGAKAALRAIAPHLSEAGLGSISEIFDGDPPHAPRGCPAQAWSVAEILQAWTEVSRLESNRTTKENLRHVR
jgi:glycogen debranching enzyme